MPRNVPIRATAEFRCCRLYYNQPTDSLDEQRFENEDPHGKHSPLPLQAMLQSPAGAVADELARELPQSDSMISRCSTEEWLEDKSDTRWEGSNARKRHKQMKMPKE